MNFTENPLLDNTGKLTEKTIKELKQHSDMLECKCPTKLLEIIELINQFESYTDECIKNYPQDKNTHEWLKYSAININKLLSATLLQLARLEGFIDENNLICNREN